MKNTYIGYKPEYITIDDEEIEFNKIKSSSEICDEINHISIYECKYLTIDDYEIDFKKINLNSETCGEVKYIYIYSIVNIISIMKNRDMCGICWIICKCMICFF